MNNGTSGNYSVTVSHEQADCLVCGSTTTSISVKSDTTIENFIELLGDNERL